MSQQKTSYTLIERAINTDDQEAWSQIYDFYKNFMLKILSNIGTPNNECEDVIQTVLVTLTKNLSTYDKSKGRFSTWLAKIVKHAGYRHFQKRENYAKKLENVSAQSEFDSYIGSNDFEKKITEEWESYLYEEACKRLEGTYRGKSLVAFKMHIEGCTLSQIEEATQYTAGTIYTLRKRVRKSIIAEIRSIAKDHGDLT